MALPMAHLIAAYLWAETRPELKGSPEFYLGAIAPDAIHIRDGNDKSHKDDVHMNNWRRPNVERVVEYWKQHFEPFDIGYGIHVLLDGYWAEGFRRDFPEILLPGGKPDPELYYNDSWTVDRTFYESSPLTPFLMEMLEKSKAPSNHPYLTRDEFEQWKNATREFYLNPKREFGKIRYITCEYTMDFIYRCSDIFTEVYDRARVDC